MGVGWMEKRWWGLMSLNGSDDFVDRSWLEEKRFGCDGI
jgi:hypothetical protein